MSQQAVQTDIEAIDLGQFAARELIKQMRSPSGVIPFVGAGVSVPFGLPSWRDFLLVLAGDCGARDEIQKSIDEGRFEDAAQHLRQLLARRAFEDEILA